MPVGPPGRWLWAASVAALCSACSSVPLERVALAPLESRGARPALACGYRLLAVIDRRATGEAAGSLGANAYSVEDAAGLVDEAELKALILAAQAHIGLGGTKPAG